MAFDGDWVTRPDGTVHVAVVDSETTGLDPQAGEVIGLGILCVRVDRHRGRMLGVVGSAFEWQEPRVYTEAAQAFTQIPPRSLAGRRIDLSKVDALLAQTDLVVAHNASFERPFLESLLPELATLRWACSLADIDWQVGQNVPYPSIDMLLKAYSMGPTDKTPEGDCHALVRILTQPLPRSFETGFHRLIAESARVSVECLIPDDDEAAQAGLEALGFERQGSRWVARREDAAGALALQMKVVELSAGKPAFAQLKMWRTDAVSRHGCAVATSKRPP
jgi:DNA polymerase-3 subunit epsilon